MDWNSPEKTKLIKAFLALRTPDEARCFMRDLLTEPEIEEFAKRLEAAAELDRGVHYNAIVEGTGLSSTTVARVARWLRRGKGGYHLILNRLRAKST